MEQTIELGHDPLEETRESTDPTEPGDPHSRIGDNRGAIRAHRTHPRQAPGARDTRKGRRVVIPEFGLLTRFEIQIIRQRDGDWCRRTAGRPSVFPQAEVARSEEHTSEL